MYVTLPILFLLILFQGYIGIASHLLDFSLLCISESSWSFSLSVVSSSLILFSMLALCFAYVYNYIFHYWGSFEQSSVNLFYLITNFVSCMVVLFFTGDFLSTLIFWEYLGLSSFFLILFFCNYSSCRASIVTLFASRFGDVALFGLAGLGVYYPLDSFVCSLFLILVLVSKSACFPFISWLLEAMRAPTPVSCLVHSSTLVAAGVWFGNFYYHLLSDSVLEAVFLLCIYTIFVSAFCALFFFDLKKLVALSTCNNISWSLLCLCLGDTSTSLLFLVSHGISKCLLFMLVGDLMSSSSGSQSGVGIYSIRYTSTASASMLLILLSSLCGLPFLGVFTWKHILIDFSCLSGNLVIYFYCCLGTFLSFTYTYRFLFLVFSRCSGIPAGLSVGYIPYLLAFLFPTLLGTTIGGVSYDFHYYIFYPSLDSLFLFIHFGGLAMGYFSYISSNSFPRCCIWSHSLGGGDYLVGFFYSLFENSSLYYYTLLYRWESLALSYLSRLVVYCRSSSLGSFGLNVLVLGFLLLGYIGFFFH